MADDTLLAPVAGVEAADRDDWMRLAGEALGGLPVDSLATRTADGIEVRALYRADDADAGADTVGLPGASPHTRGGSAVGGLVDGWDIRAMIVDDGPAAANASILDELERGSTSVLLDTTAIGIREAADLDVALAGVHLEMAAVALVPGPRSVEAAGWLVDLWDSRSVSVVDRRGDLGLDPLGVAARHGTAASVDGSLAAIARRVVGADGVRAVSVDSTPYADAGAGEAWELACSLATGVAYLRALTDGGLSLSDALGTMAFTYSATADQFLTIAKFRAARRCWDRVAGASGAAPSERAQVQRAVTSAAMTSRRDPWVNMLRTTVAGFAAGVAGADSVVVHPFDSAVGRPDAFGRRIARNTQLLLQEESGLARVIDPAGGSWYVEDLTERLAEAAWERFRSLEADGGMAAALAGGRMTAEADAAWSARLLRLTTRGEALTGVSEFPDIDEVALVRSPCAPSPGGPLPLRRLAEPFEALRDAAEASDVEPTVVLVTLGPVVGHAERAAFVVNLFEVGGIRVLDGGGSVASATGVVADSGCRLAVVCGSDDPSADEVGETGEAAAALRVAGVDRVYRVGRDGGIAGIDEVLHPGIDVLGVLGRALDVLGLARSAP